jgi:hypothetical protein
VVEPYLDKSHENNKVFDFGWIRIWGTELAFGEERENIYLIEPGKYL